MRKGQNQKFLTEKDMLPGSNSGKLIGISLGADFVSEHEWGIQGIQGAFGLDSSAMGEDRYKMTLKPENLYLLRNDKEVALVFHDFPIMRNQPRYSMEDIQRILYLPQNQEITTAWDSRSFVVYSNKKGNILKLLEIYEAFKNKNIFIFLGGGGFISNAGLQFVIADRLDPSIKKAWRKAHEHKIKETKALADSGIEEILHRAGKKYFALSPRLNDKNQLTFWLNPYEQDKYNYGSFTLQELKQWANDEGPIMMQKKTKKKGHPEKKFSNKPFQNLNKRK